MKKWVILSCWILAATTMISFSGHGAYGGDPAPLTETVAGSSLSPMLQVDQLIKEVDRHKGLIRVEGIVTAVVPDRQVVALVDIEQYKKCGVLICPTYLVLPVMWSGTMPSLKDAVIVEGQVKESGGKLILEAKSLEKLVPQSGGAK